MSEVGFMVSICARSEGGFLKTFLASLGKERTFLNLKGFFTEESGYVHESRGIYTDILRCSIDIL